MKHFLTIAFLTLNFSLLAQSYQIINSTGQHFFTKNSNNLNNMLFGVEVENITLNGNDSIFHFVNSYQDDMQNGYCTDTASWLGTKMIVENNGNNIFYNTQNEAIIILTVANLNSSWTIYNFPNGDYIEATITAINNENIVGSLMDSVKTITLQAKDNQGNSITNNINGKSLKISKNYGIVKTLKLFEFPVATTHEYTFVDNSNHIGNYKLSAETIYDYQIGDVFQYKKSHGDYHYHVEYTHTQHEVLNRVDGATTRTYTYVRSRYKEVYDDSDFDQIFDVYYVIYYSNDTISETINLVAENTAMEMDKLPFELYNTGKFAQQFNFTVGYNNRQVHRNRTYQYTTSWDSCLSIDDDWGTEADFYTDYGKGLGLVRDNFFTFSNGIDAYFNSTALVYYQKGIETGGNINANLLIIDSLNLIQESDFSIVREGLAKYVFNETKGTWHQSNTIARNIHNYISTYNIEPTYELSLDGFCKSDGGFIANKIIVDINKNTRLVNKNNDTILIKNQAPVNDTWVALHLNNGEYIEATVESINYTSWVSSFDGDIYDDNKRISFTAKDANGNGINHIVNGKYVEIGKQYGFYSGLNFIDFPNDTSFYEFQGLDNGNGLIGNNQKITPSNADYYALGIFQPGSEFHYKREVITNNTRTIYLTRKELLNMTHWYVPYEYDMQICEAIITETDNDGDGIYEQSDSSIISTNTLNITSTSELPTITGTHFERIGNNIYHFFSNPYFNGYRVDSLAFNNNICWNDNDSCWEKERYSIYTSNYGKRKEVTTNINTCTGEVTSDIFELVYYNINGGFEYGTPALSCTSYLTNNQPITTLTANVKISPNPANSTLRFETNNTNKKGQIRIYNTVGQIVFEQTFTQHFPDNYSIDISAFKNGFYITEVVIGESRKVEKVLVQH